MIKLLTYFPPLSAVAAIVLLACLPPYLVKASAPSQDESAFARRMMTLDRNKDGYLTEDELPKSVLRQIVSADLNKDGKWTSAELSTITQAARDSRAAEATPGTLQTGSRRRGRSGDAPGGRRPTRPNAGPGSPLDTAQILRFALTFDLDKDGGLNKEELQRYAAALAGRRAQARRLREAQSGQPDSATGKDPAVIPKAEQRDGVAPTEAASGLKSKSNGRNSDPFGNGSGK